MGTRLVDKSTVVVQQNKVELDGKQKKKKKRLRGVKRRAHESVLRKKKKHKSPLSDDKFRFFSIL